MNCADFVYQLLVLLYGQSLRAVGECAFGLVVDFYDEAVGSDRDTCARQRRHHVVLACAVRRINQYGQVRDAANGRSKVLRVCCAKVRMPRSQRTTL